MTLYFTRQTHREDLDFQEFQDNFVRVSADRVDELQRFYTRNRNVPGISMSLPPNTKVLKSTKYPLIRFPKELAPRLIGDGVIELPGAYFGFLNWKLKEEWWLEKEVRGSPRGHDKGFTKVKDELKAKVRTLLFSGQWIDDDSSDERLKNLHHKIKKVDLGQRRALKTHEIESEASVYAVRYSSVQTDEAKAQRRRFKKIDYRQRIQEEKIERVIAEDKETPLDFKNYDVDDAIISNEEEENVYSRFRQRQQEIEEGRDVS